MDTKRGDTRPLSWMVDDDVTAMANVRLLARDGDVLVDYFVKPEERTLDGAGWTIITVSDIPTLTTLTLIPRTWEIEVEATQAGVIKTYPSTKGKVRLKINPDLG